MTDVGAFVELENHKLSRDELVLLGMKEHADHWVNELLSQAAMQEHPIVKDVLKQVADRMAKSRDDLAVILTRSAIKSGSGRLEKLKGEH